MTGPANSDEFLDLVRRSGVSESAGLEAYVEQLRRGGTFPAEPSKLAGLLVHDGYLSHFQAEQLLQGRWRRFTIGKYRVLELLGWGDVGVVYLCQHRPTQRLVAIKVLPTAKAADPAALECFYNEARTAAACDHPNIVHAYDIDRDEGLDFIVMEFVDGSSLQEIVGKTGPMPVARAVDYIRQAALGLEHIHQAGFLHCRIEPANILVDRRGIVKVIDMGHARNDQDELARRADIYRLGASFYFLLTGGSPLGEGTMEERIARSHSPHRKPIASIRPDLPSGLSTLIDKMLAHDRNQRVQTARAVADRLAPWVPEAAQPPTVTELPQWCPMVAQLVRQHEERLSVPLR